MPAQCHLHMLLEQFDLWDDLSQHFLGAPGAEQQTCLGDAAVRLAFPNDSVACTWPCKPEMAKFSLETCHHGRADRLINQQAYRPTDSSYRSEKEQHTHMNGWSHTWICHQRFSSPPCITYSKSSISSLTRKHTATDLHHSQSDPFSHPTCPLHILRRFSGSCWS